MCWDEEEAENRRRGLIIRFKEEMEQLSNILTNGKVIELASAVVKVNPVQTNTSSTMDSEVFKYDNQCYLSVLRK